MRRGRSIRNQRGAASLFLVFLLSMVLLATLALAVDVGQRYVIQSEIQAAADANALAAATRLLGTVNSAANSTVAGVAPLDPTNSNDNRFNMRLNSLSQSTDLATSVTFDYFNQVNDAKSGTNGGQAGADARYVRVDIQVQTPTLFTRFLTTDTNPTQVRASAVAGISSPLCQVCGVDGIAVTAIDPADPENYGFFPGSYYTLYLNLSQQRPNLAACPSTVPAPLTDTLQSVAYTILNHTPVGPETETDGLLFRLGAGGMAMTSTDPAVPACITINTNEQAMPGIQGATCATARPVARNFSCGWNVRFGVDPSATVCSNIAGVSDLFPLFTGDNDLGGTAVQSYSLEYDGNARRVITVAVVDDPTNLAVLNFRQFFLQGDTTTVGLVVGRLTGAVRAQYIGSPVPVRIGTTAGSCGITRGVGKVVLF